MSIWIKASVSDCSSGVTPADDEAEGLDADCVAMMIGSREDASGEGIPAPVSTATIDELIVEASAADESEITEGVVDISDDCTREAVMDSV